MHYVIRNLCTAATKTYFVSTPIFYVNAAPHIGHLYSAVVADAAARWRRILEPTRGVLFSTGTDEHGTKIQQAALQNNTPLAVYCAGISRDYKELFNQCRISYTDFIRTTDQTHKEAVAHFWRSLVRNGYVYEADYSGWYCVPDETFLSESQLAERTLPDGRTVRVSAESGHVVEWTDERNYMFRLSAFQSDLLRWLAKNEDAVRPKKFHRMLSEWIGERDLADVSISRPSARVHWAVAVPQDSQQTVYVWLDALINYLTVAGYPDTNGARFTASWPPDLHVVGKDILKFHGVYWPAFLMAVGLEPPRRLLCHSHWTVDGEKMSKSKGNVIRPADRFDVYTAEGLRYFLLRDGVAHSDGNYSDTKVLRVLNAELADTLGNLLSRCCGAALNSRQVFPALDEFAFEKLCRHPAATQLVQNLEALPEAVADHYAEHNYYRAVDAVVATLHSANAFFEATRPWTLRKRPEAQGDLDAVLHVTMETLRVCGILLQPIVPHLADHLLAKLGADADHRTWNHLRPLSWQRLPAAERGLAAAATALLFRRIKRAEAAQKTSRAET